MMALSLIGPTPYSYRRKLVKQVFFQMALTQVFILELKPVTALSIASQTVSKSIVQVYVSPTTQTVVKSIVHVYVTPIMRGMLSRLLLTE